MLSGKHQKFTFNVISSQIFTATIFLKSYGVSQIGTSCNLVKGDFCHFVGILSLNVTLIHRMGNSKAIFNLFQLRTKSSTLFCTLGARADRTTNCQKKMVQIFVSTDRKSLHFKHRSGSIVLELYDMRMRMCRDTRCQSRQLPNLSLMDLVMSCYYRRTLCFSKWLGQEYKEYNSTS